MTKIKNRKKAFDVASKEALMVMQNILTGYNKFSKLGYINLSHDAENAQEALSVMQQFDTLWSHRLAGSTPALGELSAFFDLNNGVIKWMINSFKN